MVGGRVTYVVLGHEQERDGVPNVGIDTEEAKICIQRKHVAGTGGGQKMYLEGS